eukprot:6531315-Prymnesium_polylepis.1
MVPVPPRVADEDGLVLLRVKLDESALTLRLVAAWNVTGLLEVLEERTSLCRATQTTGGICYTRII